MEDANFEDLLLKDNLWNVPEYNIHMLLSQIFKSITNVSPPNMKYFFDLNNTCNDLRGKQLLKLSETSTSRYAQASRLQHKLSALEVALYGIRFRKY